VSLITQENALKQKCVCFIDLLNNQKLAATVSLYQRKIMLNARKQNKQVSKIIQKVVNTLFDKKKVILLNRYSTVLHKSAYFRLIDLNIILRIFI
jgi:hypothetical protein